MKPPSSPGAPSSSPRTSLFLLPGILLAAVIYLVLFPDNFRLPGMFGSSSSSSCNDNNGASATSAVGRLTAGGSPAEEAVDLRLLMGIVTTPSTYERRALLRLAYSLQPRPVRAVVDVRFVMCRIEREEDRILVALEIIAHGDVVVLNCTENMNDGKTYAYFSAVPGLFAGERYDYVGKTDDDTYYRVAALAESLSGKARRDAYQGYLTPCHWLPEKQYMSGMGYVVSWDVAEWIAATPELRDDHNDWEDVDFGGWLRKGGKYKNVYNEEPRMYDYWDREMATDVNCFRHEHIADAVAVHKLKDRLKWARTLHFFNATQGLKPSKLYHVDLQNVYHV
ncbi:unnamed protein product [Miscanthus lutarioriparius]|uniref:Hexosyltransferase n=1 Tax=Miscanthus lutarioriparius TaxID=422564 RepID=A0A811PZG9_9POAL|nr:unnamed protein product [Miscanthus lutarioriparius]